ncbi:MAG: hypothetical protein PHW12_03495 [Smithella sp.]|jgi:hypothetical protein|nr:hypothetical protein [Smithella sp.]
MYLKMMTKYPDDNSLGNRVVPVAVRTTLEGIKVMTITGMVTNLIWED